MLYWAEGSKSKNQLLFANSDRAMVAFFCRFLRQSLGVARDEITLRAQRLHVERDDAG
jgi:hypothetical protein